MAILKNTSISGTSNLKLNPSTTANRPNIVTSLIQWTNTGTQNYTVLAGPTPTLTTSSWTAPAGVSKVEVLVIAGGGGGGYNGGGGGGAGGLIYNSAYTVIPGSNYTVTVGTGGIGGSGSTVVGSQGTNSVFATLTAVGGGGGNSRSATTGTSTLAGGSGGGGASASNGFANSAGTGTSGQGTSGGVGTPSDLGANAAGGGGGGASQSGQSGSYTLAGGGGAGLNYSITGRPTWYAGGGGGGTCVNGVNPAQGGLGGGGNGGIATSAAGGTGTASTGGGGGGGNGSGTPGVGGSGTVILRYSVADNAVNSLGLMQYNSDLKAIEVYEGTATGWISQDPARNFAGHNLLNYSTVTSGNWTNLGHTFTPNATRGPDGTNTATQLTITASGANYVLQFASVYTANTIYTGSVWIKNVDCTGIKITIYEDTTGVITTTDVTSQVNTTGWTRVNISQTTSASGGTNLRFYVSGNSTGNGTSYYVWGAQFEQATAPGPYVATNGAHSPVPTSLGGYRYHTYKTVGTSGFSPAVTGEVEVLVVGGGAEGGRNGTVDGSGGGGAGGVLYTQSYPVTSGQQYTVVVGAGGVAVASPNTRSNNGNPSQFDTLVAIGGGAGGGEEGIRSGGNGGSGGGAGGYAEKPGGRGIEGQGFPGGACTGPGDGGGGGAGAAGSSGFTGRGGHGKYFPQFASVGGYPAGWFGGGGGSSGDVRNARGTIGGQGGHGGGGNGAPATTGGTAQSGGANTGGGGGGAAGSGSPPTYPSVGSVIAPGAGGSGIVIVRYRYD